MKQGKVRGSTLLEVTVASLLFVLFFSFALVAYLRLATGGYTAKRIKGQLAVEQVAQEARSASNLLNEEFAREGVLLQRWVEPYAEGQGLYLLQVYAIDENRDTIGHHRSLLYVDK